MEIPIKGISMEPFIKEGDLVEVVPSKFYLPGDVLVFFSPLGAILCHRLLGYSLKEGKIYLHLKGDNSNKKDSAVFYLNIIGKVVKIKRKGQIIEVKKTKNLYLWIKNLCQWICYK